MAKKPKVYLRDIQAAMTARDIYEAIGQWHDLTPESYCYGMELHTYLGLTWDEYKRWNATGELPENCPYY